MIPEASSESLLQNNAIGVEKSYAIPLPASGRGSERPTPIGFMESIV
jgi:hypothetical protein